MRPSPSGSSFFLKEKGAKKNFIAALQVFTIPNIPRGNDKCGKTGPANGGSCFFFVKNLTKNPINN